MTPRKSLAVTQVEDPLLCAVPLPCRREFYPHGFPVRLAANSEAVLRAAEQSWGGMPRRFDEAPIEVMCLVSGRGAGIPPFPVVRARRHLLTSVADPDNVHICDLAAGVASIWVTETVAESAEYLRYHFLEAAVYCVMDIRHVATIHAACVSFEGRGVLLAGASGAGKTSLAYACARRGWIYITDDASRILRRSAARKVLGAPRVFRFRDTAGRLFPEFAGCKQSRRGNGKPTVEVRTGALPDIRTAEEAEVHHTVFLDRREEMGAAAALTPLAEDEVYSRLLWDPWPPEIPGGEERRAAIRRVATAPSYEMSYRDLDAAVNRLEELVRGGPQ